jgi:hypothetical protein
VSDKKEESEKETIGSLQGQLAIRVLAITEHGVKLAIEVWNDDNVPIGGCDSPDSAKAGDVIIVYGARIDVPTVGIVDPPEYSKTNPRVGETRKKVILPQ